MKHSIAKWRYLLIVVILLISTTQALARSSQVVTVTNVQELLTEIGSNRTILMMAGEYPLGLLEGTELANPHLSWEAVDGELQLVLQGVENLFLIGDQAVLEGVKWSGTVLTVRDSTNVQIQGLRMGVDSIGEEKGPGAILKFEGSSEIKVGGAILYGAGSYGLILDQVTGFKMTDSIIVDAAAGISKIVDSQDLHFNKNTIWNNRGGLIIERSEQVVFRENEFLENQMGNRTFFAVVESQVVVEDSIMKQNQSKYMLEYAGCVTLGEWTDEENQFGQMYRVELEEEFLAGMMSGELARVVYAVKNGFEANIIDERYQTPLFYAVQNGQVEIARFLIENGLDVNAVDYQGLTPICYAAAHSWQPEMIRMLAEQGAKVNGVYNNFSPLIIAASMNPVAGISQALIDAGAVVDLQNPLGGTALLYTAKNGKYPINLQVLVKNGANLNQKHTDQSTPLMYAAENNENPAMVEMLIQLGAKVNEQNKHGRTALSYALVRGNSPEVIMALLANGADPTIEDKYGVSGIEYAQMQRKTLRGTPVWDRLSNWGKEVVTEEVGTKEESAEEVSTEEESAEEESAEEESAGEESAEEESAEEESAEKESAGEESDAEESTEGESAGEESAEGESDAEVSTEGESAEGESAEEESTEEESAEEVSDAEESAEGESAGENSTQDENNN